MKKGLYCRITAVGIIVLFMGVSVVSSSTVLINDIYAENIEINTIDENKEIFTIIKGLTKGYTQTNRGLLWRNIQMDAIGQGFEINGWKEPNFQNFFIIGVKHIKVPLFIGWMIPDDEAGGYFTVYGFAIGNIDWSIDYP